MINLLNHGHVRLVDSMGNDLSVVRNARVSYDAEWRTGEDAGKDEKLIHYLMKHGHTSPFESVTFTFDIKAPIFVFRQWHRHRTWSFNEVSARYTELPEEYFIPKLDTITTQSTSNKQMRTIEPHPHAFWAAAVIVNSNVDSFENYKLLIKEGVPRELARTVLPMGTYSHMFATVNLHNLFKFIKERTSSGAQYEIKVYAEALLRLIEPIVPISLGAFIKYNVE